MVCHRGKHLISDELIAVKQNAVTGDVTTVDGTPASADQFDVMVMASLDLNN